MQLLHPPISPWLKRFDDGCEIAVLIDHDPAATQLSVYLRSLADNEEELVPMRAAGRNGRWYRFEGWLGWDNARVNTRYAFVVLHDDEQHWLGADGIARPYPPAEALMFRVSHDAQPPAWVRSQVFYQIFPDRFARGRPPADRSSEKVFGNEPRMVQQLDWEAPLDPTHAATTFYGGDLDGIVDRLDYLADELGITALYLNPIFTSGSNHKYDTEDYETVDPHFGGNAALERLCTAARGRGLRVILDAVLNHTGSNHPWFNRWNQHPQIGAYQSGASPYRDWYAFDSAGRPLGWKGHASLPILDYAAPGVRAAMYESENAVVRRWLRPPYAIDGWRLDVVHMMGEGPGAANNAAYVGAIRRAIKEVNPQAYVLGEHFAEATNWLQGDQEDAAMNYYGFAHPVRAWLAGHDMLSRPQRLTTSAFAQWLNLARAPIPYETQLAQLNLIGSHDTPRFLTTAGSDAARLMLAVTLQACYPGVPCIYYGDEIGLEGGRDPDCRRCFPWERTRWDAAIFAHTRAMVLLRRTRHELAHGAVQTLAVGDDHWIFARHTDTDATIVAVNRGTRTEVIVDVSALPLTIAEWFDTEGRRVAQRADRIDLPLPAMGAAIVFGGGALSC